MQPMFVNGTCPGKSWKKGFLSPENPGIWSLQVLENPGKKHLNFCTNPVGRNVSCEESTVSPARGEFMQIKCSV